MRTKASIRSHPIHAMLIPFPIAFLVGAFGFDLAGRLAGSAPLWTVGAYLAPLGVAMGLLAAIPGLIDYFYSVPPDSTGRGRATKHMLVNVGALSIFAAASWLRGDPANPPDTALLLAQALGLGLLAVGGWLGGTMVYRNFVGPDHRYANAGKWSEEQVPEPKAEGEAVRVAGSDELEVDQMKLVRVNGRRLVLARTEDGYAAFDDRCSHRGGSLAGGVLMCGRVQCLWHGSQFDVGTGEVRAGPAEEPISTYEVEEVEGEVRVRLGGPYSSP